MKNLLLILLIMFIMTSYSCSDEKVKEDIVFYWGDGNMKVDEDKLPYNPTWLEDKIKIMSTSASYRGAKVDLYYWYDKFYYVINLPYSKSVGRDLYTVPGGMVTIVGDRLVDFYNERHFKGNIWTDYRLRFVPTEVVVQTKALYTINKVFDLINSLQLNVGYIDNCVFRCSLPSDSSTYVLNYINSKTYTHKGNWSGAVNVLTPAKVITVYPVLFDMRNKSNQLDWLNTMSKLKLTESTNNSYLILFNVPNGEELEWSRRFASSDSISHATISEYINIELH